MKANNNQSIKLGITFLVIFFSVLIVITFSRFRLNSPPDLTKIYENSNRSIAIMPFARLDIPPKDFELMGISIISNLDSFIKNGEYLINDIDLVYLHPRLINDENRDDLNKMYQDQKILVVFDTTVEDIKKIIQAPDISHVGFINSQNYVKNENRYLVTLIHLSKYPQGGRGSYVFSDIINPQNLDCFFASTLGYLERVLLENEQSLK